MSQSTDATAGSPDAYVTWHSPAGHHGLHGPYPHDIAQQLANFTPYARGEVVVGSVGATDRFRIAELLLTYNAPRSNSRSTALLMGMVHKHATNQTAVRYALEHVLADFDDDADLAEITDALIDAGFTKRR